MQRIKAALKRLKLSDLECRMVWIIYHVRGEESALELAEKFRAHELNKEVTA